MRVLTATDNIEFRMFLPDSTRSWHGTRPVGSSARPWLSKMGAMAPPTSSFQSMSTRSRKRRRITIRLTPEDRVENTLTNARAAVVLSAFRTASRQQLLDDPAICAVNGSRWIAHLAAREPGCDCEYSRKRRPAEQPV